jgi:hypothetical protein
MLRQLMTKQIVKSSGLTPSEQYLAKLCEKSFLSVWSYPNLFNDRGRKNGKGSGKELCDLLVIFGKNVIIFSDKSCAFPSGDIEIAWKRWYRNSIEESVNQVYGAERWIKKFPDRIFLDSLCKTQLPLVLPNNDEIKIYRVIVALNAGKHVKSYFESKSGSLALIPHQLDDISINSNLPSHIPFHIEQTTSNKGYVHVFDDESLDIILKELDTILDFVNYLERKEGFLRSELFKSAVREEDLLAFYLLGRGRKPFRQFMSSESNNHDYLEQLKQGLWEELNSHPQFIARNKMNKQSYVWDELIEEFIESYVKNTLPMCENETDHAYLKAVQHMASENRFYRRVLSRAYKGFLQKNPNRSGAIRVRQAPNDPTTAYVFILLDNITSRYRNYEEYLQYREYFLYAHCQIVKLNIPNFKIIIGIGDAPPASKVESKKNLIYLDASNWEKEDYEEARKKQKELAVAFPEKPEHIREHEYPDIYPVYSDLDVKTDNPKKVDNKKHKKKIQKEIKNKKKKNRSK